jgi:D-alanine-D-alanine ligase
MTGKHVAVLMGGWVNERPVSLSTGKECADALEEAGYRVTRVDVDRNVSAVLKDLKPDVVFNALARALRRGRLRSGNIRVS